MKRLQERHGKYSHRLIEMRLWGLETQLRMQETEHNTWDAQPGRQRCGWDTDNAVVLGVVSMLITTESSKFTCKKAQQVKVLDTQPNAPSSGGCKVDI